MKERLLKLLKTILTAFLIWFGITTFFVLLDNSLGISEKFDWVSFVGLALPILLTFFYVARSLYRSSPQRKAPQHKTPARTALTDSPTQETLFPPTGNSQIDGAMAIVDTMEGHEFERFCAEFLERCGYKNVHVTKGSGDQGVDIIAIKYGMRYAFQCKRYSSKLGNKPVQEVHTGKQFYSCQKGVVITNSYFTRGAEDAARRVGVELWDRDTLIRKMGYQAPSV